MRYFSGKLVRLLLIILASSALTFFMVDLLPGDAAFSIAGQGASMEEIENIRRDLGLDRPLGTRYMEWIGQVLRGNLGKSYLTQEDVTASILSRLPVTLELMVLAQLFALGLALPAGIIAAYKAGTILDRTLSSVGFSLMAVPIFVLSLLLIYLFAIKLRWLPATGQVAFSSDIAANLRSYILPALSIALVEWVPLMRVLRSDMLTTLKEGYILMARAKGLPTGHILLWHALRPSSFTLVTIFGIQIGHLIGGALIVEIIFALPGLGRLLVNSIFSRDVLMVQGCILFITAGYVTVNFMVDMIYAMLDPRIRRDENVD